MKFYVNNMPSTWCLTQQGRENLEKALREYGDFRKFSLLDSSVRRDYLAKYIGEDNAKEVNAVFENKLTLKNQKSGLKSFVETVLKPPKEVKTELESIIEKLDKALTPNEVNKYLEDFASKALGRNVSEKEAQFIFNKATELQKQSEDVTEFGTPTLEYFKARKELNDYLDSLDPTPRLRVATQTIGRGMLLASIKSPLLNIESNTVHGLINAAERRIENRRFSGANNEYAKRFRKFNNKVFLETGFDLTRMFSLDDRRLIRGEDVGTTQGKGAVRKVGRVVEDVVFKKMQGYPDVVSSGIAFSDRANIQSTKMAKREGLKGTELKQRALDIFKDATRIDPKTPEGLLVREAAIADAQYSTYTNDTKYSDLALGIRKLFNLASGDLRVGDQIMPFVKTPANVIGAGIDSSGTLLPADLTIRMLKGLNGVRKGQTYNEAFGESFKGFSKKIILAGLGITFAYLLSTMFKKEDFIGEYPTSEKERKLLELKQARERSIKMGGKWVSLDYFGPLAAPLVGFLYAKKYGHDLPSSAWNYYSGVLAQAKSLPGLDEFKDVIDTVKDFGTSGASFEEQKKDATNFLIDFVRSRSIPSIVSDTARGTDTVERRTDKGVFDKVFNGIPGLRQLLPEKKNIFGETIKTSGAISTYLFGARVNKSNNDSVIKELDRLAESGALPSITDVEKTSSRAKALKKKIGDAKFDKAKTEFGKELYIKFRSAINSSTYKSKDDEGKQNILDKIKTSEFNRMLKRYGYKKV